MFRFEVGQFQLNPEYQQTKALRGMNPRSIPVMGENQAKTNKVKMPRGLLISRRSLRFDNNIITLQCRQSQLRSTVAWSLQLWNQTAQSGFDFEKQGQEGSQKSRDMLHGVEHEEMQRIAEVIVIKNG
jgi:hypothetical protein